MRLYKGAKKNQKNEGWNDEVTATVETEENAWKDVFETKNQDVKKKMYGIYKEKTVRKCKYQE